MTKDSYFEMCQALGSEPVDSEIPLELSDFPTEFITAWTIYQSLKSVYNPMSGAFEGKDMTLLMSIFDLFEVDPSDRIEMFKIIQIIDNESQSVSRKKSTTKSGGKK